MSKLREQYRLQVQLLMRQKNSHGADENDKASNGNCENQLQA